eukprot:1245848-Karenia_brevis.AAC.1
MANQKVAHDNYRYNEDENYYDYGVNETVMNCRRMEAKGLHGQQDKDHLCDVRSVLKKRMENRQGNKAIRHPR